MKSLRRFQNEQINLLLWDEVLDNSEVKTETVEDITDNLDVTAEKNAEKFQETLKNTSDENKEKIAKKTKEKIEESGSDLGSAWAKLWEFLRELFDGDLEVEIGDSDEDEKTEDNNKEEKEHKGGINSLLENLKGNFKWPVVGRISSHFGKRKAPKKGASTNHGGTDIAAPEGTLINPTQAGTVSKVSYDGVSGNYLKIKHPDGTESLYCHLKEAPSVKVGQSVSTSTNVGKVGSTGVSTGPHLHFEVRYNGQKLDPEDLLA